MRVVNGIHAFFVYIHRSEPLELAAQLGLLLGSAMARNVVFTTCTLWSNRGGFI